MTVSSSAMLLVCFSQTTCIPKPFTQHSHVYFALRTLLAFSRCVESLSISLCTLQKALQAWATVARKGPRDPKASFRHGGGLNCSSCRVYVLLLYCYYPHLVVVCTCCRCTATTLSGCLKYVLLYCCSSYPRLVVCTYYCTMYPRLVLVCTYPCTATAAPV